MPETNSKFPRARVDKIISRKVQDELIIYDLARHVATCLNSFAADVWDRCDGHSSPAAIAQALSQNRQRPVDERAVWLAVDHLSRSKLLDEPIKMPPSVLGGASRRQLLRTLSLSAAFAVPVVLSMKSPTAAQVASCANQACGSDLDCCPGFFVIPRQVYAHPDSGSRIGDRASMQAASERRAVTSRSCS